MSTTRLSIKPYTRTNRVESTCLRERPSASWAAIMRIQMSQREVKDLLRAGKFYLKAGKTKNSLKN